MFLAMQSSRHINRHCLQVSRADGCWSSFAIASPLPRGKWAIATFTLSLPSPPFPFLSLAPPRGDFVPRSPPFLSSVVRFCSCGPVLMHTRKCPFAHFCLSLFGGRFWLKVRFLLYPLLVQIMLSSWTRILFQSHNSCSKLILHMKADTYMCMRTYVWAFPCNGRHFYKGRWK